MKSREFAIFLARKASDVYVPEVPVEEVDRGDLDRDEFARRVQASQRFAEFEKAQLLADPAPPAQRATKLQKGRL